MQLKPGELTKATPLFVVASLGIAISLLVGAQGFVVLGVVGVAALAFANGANDLPKSIATLVGTGELSYRRAIWSGVVATMVGGALAILWSSGLLRLFSSGGITAVDISLHPLFPIAVVVGAASWVLLATRFGLPVSTTHALIGASVGGALAVQGASGINWGTLAPVVIIPLLAAPLVAVPLGFAINRVASIYRLDERRSTHRIIHLLSALGSVVARTLNDTPKIAGVGLLVLAIGESTSSGQNLWLIALTVAAMCMGGLLACRRVCQTLAFQLANLDSNSGLAANASNSVLVSAASALGLPLSTTHVSGAAMAGAALGSRHTRLSRKVTRDIITAWVVTVPGAALLSIVLWWSLRGMSLLA